MASAACAVDPPQTLRHAGRDILVHVPSRLPAPGARALVVVLHGGLGNASRIATSSPRSPLNFDAVADADGFVVAYLDGTPVARRLGPRFLGWNAGGGCCGVPFETDVDDVGYIGGAVDDLVRRYGIDRSRVFGLGHSNGAMMVQRMICETTVFAAGVAIAGPLNVPTRHCVAAAGRRILALHGDGDRHVPVAGGVGPMSLSRLDYRSEEDARRVLEGSGATYTLQVVAGADHGAASVEAAIEKAEGRGIAAKAAAFFGLAGTR